MLVKHSLPAVDPGAPAAEWPLSEEGRARCRPLAEHLRRYDAGRLIASTEPKAAETAALVGAELELRVELDDRLREQDRTGAAWLDEEAFAGTVAEALARPDELVLGRETVAAARERFGASVEEHRALASGTLVAVAHGTVIAAYAAKRAHTDAAALWRRLGLPSLVALDGAEILEVIDSF